ncbi:AAA family ATPase [Asanoa sp. NPDC049518]|uniref:McrB family protein n=1 Tax=unclassified Asanoa TaxID=2685164 RepID=UPI00344256CE
MSLSEIDLSAVEVTLAEFDELGREAFLAKYGFGTATTYVLRHKGRFYDPKAVAGVAHRYTPAGEPLAAGAFDATQAIARLTALGLEVLPLPGLWWVNQGATYDLERDGGFVWAPQQTKAGYRVAHHTDVARLRVGQRIVHYANGAIRAVGTVAEAPYEARRPAGFSGEAWGELGNLCPVDYHELDIPIPRAEIPNRSADVGPFDVQGNVKQGYLFKIGDANLFGLLSFLNERIPDFFGDATTHPHLTEPLPEPSMTEDPVFEALMTFKNVVLEGVPGTGKSYAIERLAASWRERTGRDLLEFNGRKYGAIVLHPSSSYEDFIEGLRPEAKDTGATMFDQPVESTGKFGLQDGFFVSICAAAVAAPDKDVLVLLDELNRCNVPSVFGDLLLTLEVSRRARYRHRRPTASAKAQDWETPTPAQLPYSKRSFFVPDNVYVIATTNTTDRSVAPLDAALRRRFAFHRLEPQMPTADVLNSTVSDPARELFTTSVGVLRDLNDHALRPCLGPDAVLGHSYLYAAAAMLQDAAGVELAVSRLKLHWQYTILPQLIDSVRALGAESLLDPHTRGDWFTEHADLDHLSKTAQTALAQLDDFVHKSLELQVVVEGTGLARGARIAAQRNPEAEAESPGDAREPANGLHADTE